MNNCIFPVVNVNEKSSEYYSLLLTGDNRNFNIGEKVCIRDSLQNNSINTAFIQDISSYTHRNNKPMMYDIIFENSNLNNTNNTVKWLNVGKIQNANANANVLMNINNMSGMDGGKRKKVYKKSRKNIRKTKKARKVIRK